MYSVNTEPSGNSSRNVFTLRWIVGDDAEILGERQFQLLLLMNVMAPLGSALLSPVLESLIDPFGVSAANIGLMISAFTAPAIVMIPVTGMLADRYGRRPVLIFGLLCFGGAGTAIALTTDFTIALLLRLLQGVGFASLSPIIITSIGDLYEGTEEATAQGLRFTGSGVVQTVFPLAAGVLVVLAWQYPFLLHLIAFPIAIAVYIWFEEPVDSAATESDDRDVGEQLRNVWALATQRRAAAMLAARGTPNVVWIGFLTYNSILIVEVMGGTPTQAGALAAFGSISYATSASQAGRITARFESRLHPLIAMNIALAAGTSVVFLAPSVWVAYAGIVLMGVGFGVLLSIYRSIVTDLAPPALRGGLVGIAESMGRVTSTLTPIVMGGGIALATPRLGFATAVQAVGVSAGVLTAAIGIVCLLVLSSAPPIRSPIE
jgi:ACDE family multidrug resistance protein